MTKWKVLEINPYGLHNHLKVPSMRWLLIYVTEFLNA